ncbi:Uncharacterised protein [Serratia proteamaculans]|nr:Uncharacterised protein [Serratia proteamaculans]
MVQVHREPHFNTDTIPVEKISENLSTHIIKTNEDKLRNILDKYERKIAKKGKVVTHLSVAMTLLISLLTSDFKEFITIPATVWRGLFILGFIASVIIALFMMCRQKTPSVNDLINEISGVKKNN